ncbi:substrate-binding domain-containing protein [Streptomyces sp. NPDC001046]|uniref:substrate-binding domain-containing protein n=1 Tax=Streptomyces sp. NPDC001046 TaxID=3364543 RepID=UPI0036C5A1AA
MLSAQRREHILAALEEQSFVSVTVLAEEFSVSRMTVRRDIAALEAEGLVSAVRGGATRRPPEGSGATPAAGTRGGVGVIVPVADYYYWPILDAARETLSGQGFDMSVMVSGYDRESERRIADQMLDSDAQCLIIAPTFDQESIAGGDHEWLYGLPAPVVLLERELPATRDGRTVSSVRTAYETGWERAGRELRSLGHERVALVTHGLRQIGVDLDRVWERAAERAGFELAGAVTVVDARLTGSPAQGVLDEVIGRIRKAEVTAVVSHCDQATLGLVHAMRRRGMSIPDDLSIVTNEDEVAQMTTPALTSCSPATHVIGRQAARLALDLLDGDGAPVQHVRVEPSLTKRSSCRPPAAR